MTTVFDFSLLEKVDCVRSDEASENCCASSLSSAMLMDEVFASLHSIYGDRSFLMVSYVRVRNGVIGHKKTIEKDNKRNESENVNIYDDKKQTNWTTDLG